MTRPVSSSRERSLRMASPPEGAHRTDAAFARLPSVDAVLSCDAASALSRFSRDATVGAIRRAIAALRQRMQAGDAPQDAELAADAVATAARAMLDAEAAPRIGRVVNATGVVLHTNLGRALLAAEAVDAVAGAACGACNLEYDVALGARGDRDALVEEHLCALTGAEAATVVNNNAAGVLLALSALASGREVVVSRGELVEIGGSFRVPEIMAASGAILREVGATNRTHLADYERAIGAATAVLMKVHASNYRIVGFTASVALGELAALAGRHEGILVIEDLGAGALVDVTRFGLAPEPTVGDRIAAGADLVLASGDKLLGGPQCGILAGRAGVIAKLRSHPLKRALRCDKMTLAALEATLRIYRFSADPSREIPTLRFLARPLEALEETARAAALLLAAHLGRGFTFEVVRTTAEAGSGSQPDAPVASIAVAVRSGELGPMDVARLFRASSPPVIGRIAGDVFLLDMRLVEDPRDVVPSTR